MQPFPAPDAHQATRPPAVPQPPAAPQAPVELELGDGSRLVLDSAEASPIICRVEGMRDERINLEDAMQLNGQPFAGFRLLR